MTATNSTRLCHLAQLNPSTPWFAAVAADMLPWVADPWVDPSRTRVGHEISLTRHFYKCVSPCPLAEIDAEIKALEQESQALLAEVTE